MAAYFDSKDEGSPTAYNASQTALLFLDFQAFAIKLCGDDGAVAVANAKMLRDWALSHKVMVIHSVVDTKGHILPTTKARKSLIARIADINNEAHAHEEPPELAPSNGLSEHVVLKPPGLVSGLKSKGIQDLLKEHGIKSLIICGLSTSGAVLRTTTAATDEGFVVTVIRDACADYKKELHTALLEGVLPNRAHVASAKDFINEWKKVT